MNDVIIELLHTYRDRLKAGADLDKACDFITDRLDWHIAEAKRRLEQRLSTATSHIEGSQNANEGDERSSDD